LKIFGFSMCMDSSVPSVKRGGGGVSPKAFKIPRILVRGQRVEG
jgi:hypothetical protein